MFVFVFVFLLLSSFLLWCGSCSRCGSGGSSRRRGCSGSILAVAAAVVGKM